MPDIAGNSGTTASIGVGATLTNILEAPGDHDWFRLTLTAGQTVSITLNSSGTSPLADPFLRLFAPDGQTLLRSNDDSSGYNSQIIFTATSSGTYFIDAGAWDDRFAGTYELSVQPSAPPPPLTVWSYDQIAGQLVSGYWDGATRHFNVTQGGTITVNIVNLTPEGQFFARSALDLWSDILGIRFVEVTSGEQMFFDDAGAGANSRSSVSGGIIYRSEVNVETSWISGDGTNLDSYSLQTYIHEIGHALGLGHAGGYNGSADYPYDALYANDSWSTTVMSYFSQQENTHFANQGFSTQFVMSPMVADIIAMSQLYGLSTTTRTGDTTYGFNSNAGRSIYNAAVYSSPGYTIFDSGGNDTLDYSSFSQNQRIDLNSESFSNVGGLIGNVSIARGTVIENAIGGSGSDVLIGNSANNVLTGGAGFDTLTGGAGNDTLNGGAGRDTAIYSGLSRSYSVQFQSGSGSVAGGSEGGTDRLSSIEFIRFRDGTIQFDPDGPAAQVTRLYDAALQRAPDMPGLDLLVDFMEDQGGSLRQVASMFLNSPEFQARTGSLSNADYVEFLYRNTLDRASDPSGKAYWVDQLNKGADRADLLIAFSESQEHRSLTAASVSQGFFNTDDAYQSIALLYDSFAGRAPDRAGLIVWAEAIRSGALTLGQVADEFAHSVEFRSLTAGMSNAQLVEFMYQNSLDRAPDPAGLDHWTRSLDAGMDRGDLLLAFSQSQEHFFLLGPHITNGIDYLS